MTPFCGMINKKETQSMKKIAEVFEKLLVDFFTIDWSESDGSDVKELIETYFDDIPNDRGEIRKLFENCTKINKFQKHLAIKMLEAI